MFIKSNIMPGKFLYVEVRNLCAVTDRAEPRGFFHRAVRFIHRLAGERGAAALASPATMASLTP